MLNNAAWISYPEDLDYECPLLFNSFKTFGKIKKATLSISARGCYYAEINGI